MTDKEIIKALECCRDKIFKGCDNCPMDEDNDCIEIVCANAVGFINRQQAEIEQKNKQIEELVDFQRFCKKKAIKEFAKTLQEDVEYHIDEIGEFVPYIRVSDIQRVTKEMVGTSE